jgi:hypothetical protein
MTATETPIEHLRGINSAVEAGCYRLQSLTLGDPSGKLYAPPGSEYTDLQTGIRYWKDTGFDDHGWVCSSVTHSGTIDERPALSPEEAGWYCQLHVQSGRLRA